jgi:hypothetical protein
MAAICADAGVMLILRTLRNTNILDSFRVLDSGTYGYVLEARCTRARNIVALKVIRSTGPINRLPQATLRELRALTNFCHPNILNLQRMYVVGTKCVVLQTARYDCSLAAYRRDAAPLPPPACQFVFSQVCAGVAAAHAAGVMHRDLKPGNIFLRTCLPEVVVGDWGLARAAADAPSLDMLTGEVITTWYAPPEVLQAKGYSFPADVWSLGIILLELFLWRHVFRNTDRSTFMQDILAMHAALPVYVAAAEGNFADLLPRMLALAPEERITMAAVMEHPYCTTATAQPLPVHRTPTTTLLLGHRQDIMPPSVMLLAPPIYSVPGYRGGWPPACRSTDRVALLQLASTRFGAHWLAPYLLAMDIAWISGCSLTPSRMYACFTLASASMLPAEDVAYRDRRTSPYYGETAINNAYDLADLELEILQLLHGRLPWPRPEMAPLLALAPSYHKTAAFLASYPDVMTARGWDLARVASACESGDIDDALVTWMDVLMSALL